MVIASMDDGIYINSKTKQEVDIDEQYKIGNIKEIIFDTDDDVFYILSNKYMEKLGFFVLKMHESDPL